MSEPRTFLNRKTASCGHIIFLVCCYLLIYEIQGPQSGPSLLSMLSILLLSTKIFNFVQSQFLPPPNSPCKRCMFVQENKCAERLLTAENDALYTTFTEMFAQHTADGTTNRLISVLGEPLLELLFDLLVLPGGPRHNSDLSDIRVYTNCF